MVFPELPEYNDLLFSKHSDPCPVDSVAFLATPNNTSLELVPRLLEQGRKVIDLSGSFRIPDRALFEKYYGLEHAAFDLMKEAVYGMPEIYRESLPPARLVSNPGCYPTGSILPLHFLGELRSSVRQVIIDAKSGVSGAGGRTEDSGFAFQNVYENFRAYKVLKHQHTPEIQIHARAGMSRFRGPEEAGESPALLFTPHLLPIYRGILSTIIVEWNRPAPEDLPDRFKKATEKEPFMRYLDSPEEVELRKVQNTNFVDFSARNLGNITVIVSAIDNLVKGAAGQAIQNMNLLFGQPETSGLIG